MEIATRSLLPLYRLFAAEGLTKGRARAAGGGAASGSEHRKRRSLEKLEAEIGWYEVCDVVKTREE